MNFQGSRRKGRLSATAVGLLLLAGEHLMPGAEEPLPLRIGVPVEAALGNADPSLAGKGRHRAFRLKAEKAGKITIRMESRAFNAYLLVRSGEGATLAGDDDGGPGDGAQAVFEAQAGKEYAVLAASAREEEIGGFLLEASEGEAP